MEGRAGAGLEQSPFVVQLRAVFRSRTLPPSSREVLAEFERGQIPRPRTPEPCRRCDRFERTLTRIMLVKLAASCGGPFRGTLLERA